MQSRDDPQFDASMPLVVVGLSALGVMSNIVRMRSAPSLAKFRKSLVCSVLGVIATGAIASIATWLRESRPDLVSRYVGMYSKGSQSSQRYRAWLSDRILQLIAEYGVPTPENKIADKFALNGRATPKEPATDQ